ncbi:hypothetical protein AAY473_034771 [Plecturocebus cupreus]
MALVMQRARGLRAGNFSSEQFTHFWAILDGTKVGKHHFCFLFYRRGNESPGGLKTLTQLRKLAPHLWGPAGDTVITALTGQVNGRAGAAQRKASRGKTCQPHPSNKEHETGHRPGPPYDALSPSKGSWLGSFQRWGFTVLVRLVLNSQPQVIRPPWPPKCLDYRCEPPRLAATGFKLGIQTSGAGSRSTDLSTSSLYFPGPTGVPAAISEPPFKTSAHPLKGTWPFTAWLPSSDTQPFRSSGVAKDHEG